MRQILILSFVISTIINLNILGTQVQISIPSPVDQNIFEESILFNLQNTYETSIIYISSTSEIELEEEDKSPDYFRNFNSLIVKNKDFKKYLIINQKEQIISSYLLCFELDLPPPIFILQ